MTRAIPKKALALLWAVLLLLTSAGEGFGLHPCPYHDAYPGGPEQGHDHGHGQGHGGELPSNGEGKPDPCTHLEVCPTGSGPAVAADLSLVPTWVAAAGGEADPAPVESFRAAFLPFFLPYGQAPPARG